LRFALLRVLFACLLLATFARAEPVATLVLITGDPADAVSARLERDLRGLGFSIVVLGATPENSSDTAALERTARSLGSMATLRVLPLQQGCQLWVTDPSTGRSVTRELLAPPGASPDANELALGTLELLRASMLELRPALPATPPAATTPAPPPPAAPSPVFSLSGGFGAELGLHSFSPSLTSVWAAWLNVHGLWGARAFTALPLTSERGDVREGSVEVRTTLVGAGFTLDPGQNKWWLEPRASWGVTFARIETHGTAVDPRASSGAAVWLTGGYALLGAGVRLARDVRLDLDLTGVVLPQPAIILGKRSRRSQLGRARGSGVAQRGSVRESVAGPR